MMSSAASTKIVKRYYTGRKKTKRGADGFSDEGPILILSHPGEHVVLTFTGNYGGGDDFFSEKLL